MPSAVIRDQPTTCPLKPPRASQSGRASADHSPTPFSLDDRPPSEHKSSAQNKYSQWLQLAPSHCLTSKHTAVAPKKAKLCEFPRSIVPLLDTQLPEIGLGIQRQFVIFGARWLRSRSALFSIQYDNSIGHAWWRYQYTRLRTKSDQGEIYTSSIQGGDAGQVIITQAFVKNKYKNKTKQTNHCLMY